MATARSTSGMLREVEFCDTPEVTKFLSEIGLAMPNTPEGIAAHWRRLWIDNPAITAAGDNFPLAWVLEKDRRHPSVRLTQLASTKSAKSFMICRTEKDLNRKNFSLAAQANVYGGILQRRKMKKIHEYWRVAAIICRDIWPLCAKTCRKSG